MIGLPERFLRLRGGESELFDKGTVGARGGEARDAQRLCHRPGVGGALRAHPEITLEDLFA
jgi:hypothetical protein